MKRTVFLSVILAAAIFLAACGTSAPAAQPAQPAAALPAGAQASGAQVASGQAGAAQPVSAGGATEVDVTLADNTIQSSLTTFKVGVPYKFVIINNGNHLHNFNISTPVVGGDTQAAASSALLTVPQEQLPIGGGTTVTFTFPASAAGQSLEFSCLIPRHYELGMRLAITVTK